MSFAGKGKGRAFEKGGGKTVTKPKNSLRSRPSRRNAVPGPVRFVCVVVEFELRRGTYELRGQGKRMGL